VKYYKDPERHPDRQYIGVAFERDQKLPTPRNAMRRRRLGMVATKMQPVLNDLQELLVETKEPSTDVAAPVRKPITQVELKPRKGEKEKRILHLRPGYMYRESNFEIGRAAERAGIKVKLFKPRDRWTAWRKATERKARNAESRNLKKLSKKKKS